MKKPSIIELISGEIGKYFSHIVDVEKYCSEIRGRNIVATDITTELKPYTCRWFGEDCAILVFAPSAREAKKTGYNKLEDFSEGYNNFIDVRVRLIRDIWPYKLADFEKLIHNETHAITENLPYCDMCGWWGEGVEI